MTVVLTKDSSIEGTLALNPGGPSAYSESSLEVGADLTIPESGMITIHSGGNIENSGNIKNLGNIIINNKGGIDNLGGNITIYSGGSIDNKPGGEIDNDSLGIFPTNSTITIHSGGIFNNSGKVTNVDTVDNSGTINNIHNEGTYGTIDNTGGTIKNTGSLNNDIEATFTGSPPIDNPVTYVISSDYILSDTTCPKIGEVPSSDDIHCTITNLTINPSGKLTVSKDTTWDVTEITPLNQSTDFH